MKDSISIRSILVELTEELINYDTRMTEAKAPPVRFTHKYTSKAEAQIFELLESKAVDYPLVTYDFGTALEVGREKAVPLSALEELREG